MNDPVPGSREFAPRRAASMRTGPSGNDGSQSGQWRRQAEQGGVVQDRELGMARLHVTVQVPGGPGWGLAACRR